MVSSFIRGKITDDKYCFHLSTIKFYSNNVYYLVYLRLV